MIDAKTYQELIQNPSGTVDYTSELKSLVEENPWFQQGWMLYTKGLKLSGSPDFEEELHRAAVHVTNREQLFEFVMSEHTSDADVVNEKSALRDEPEENENEPDNSLKTAENAKESSQEGIETIGSDESVSKETKEEEREFEEKKIVAKKNEERLEKSSVSEKDELLQKQILTDAVSAVIEKETLEQSEIGELSREKIEEEEKVDKWNKSESSESYSSYTAWILRRAREIHYVEEEVSQESEANSKAANKLTDSKEDRSRLLDEFIAKDPRITPGKSKEYDIQDYAKASLQSSDDFITETMALIYVQQGKISKAKQAYRLLSLKYPEKSIYFAARIKELDKKNT